MGRHAGTRSKGGDRDHHLKRAMATNVRRERQLRELTQEELADRAGLGWRMQANVQSPQ